MQPRGSQCNPLALLLLLVMLAPTSAQRLAEPYRCIYPEQRRVNVRAPHDICRLEPPHDPPPRTVAVPDCHGETFNLSLDDAITIALSNAEVIRVLAGSTGQTVYDPAITNTQVDVQRSAFDPTITLDNFYNHNEAFVPAPVPPGPDVRIALGESDVYDFSGGFSQRKATGGTLTAGVSVSPTNSDPAGLLDPQTPTGLNVGYNQPLLRGRGRCANLAPIVIARLDTERSFYQLKDSVQDMVRGVVEGYWSIVAARVTVWATKQQIEQLEFTYNFFNAQQQVGRSDLGEVAQTQVSLANFRANLIAAEADLLNREAAFRNLLGLPPVDQVCFSPVTPPLTQRQSFVWQQLVEVAEQHRPDIIELKLRIETDQQRLIVADNNALPTVNAVGNHNVTGLGGTNPATGVTSSRFGANNVQLGLQVNLPLGLRADRALLRQAELSLARDKALLRQQLHATTHALAQSVRNLDQFYDQYEAFKNVREAARVSLDRQFALFRAGGLPTERVTYLNVLQAVTDWGNAVSSEAGSLAQYNIELASLQRQVGTIIEDHGIRFYEEYYSSLGPLCDCKCYGESMWTTANQPRYEVGDKPSEESFDLESSVTPSRKKTREDAPDEEDPDERARRLRDQLSPPRRIEPLTSPDDVPPPRDANDNLPDPGRPTDKPVEPPPTPPTEGRVPGDDLKELLDKIRELPNPLPDEDE